MHFVVGRRMAWYNRIPAVKQVIRGVNRINRALRGTPPTRTVPLPERYRLEPSGVVPPQPSDSGIWFPIEEYEPGAYEYVYEEELPGLYAGEPDDTVTLV